MAISIHPVGEGIRATRHKRLSLEASDEWLTLKAAMAEGIKPYQEVQTTFTAQDRERLGIKWPKRTFRDMAKAWIKRARLPYNTISFTTKEGLDVIKVQNIPVLVKDTSKEISSPVATNARASTGNHKKKRA